MAPFIVCQSWKLKMGCLTAVDGRFTDVPKWISKWWIFFLKNRLQKFLAAKIVSKNSGLLHCLRLSMDAAMNSQLLGMKISSAQGWSS